MSTLLDKFLLHYDPIYHGRTASGLACGLAATRGLFFPLIAGAYLLKRGTSRASIDQVVGASPAGATTITEFPWIGHAPATAYFYRVVPIGGGGVEAVLPDTDDQVVVITSDAGGGVPEPAPDAPQRLSCRAIAGGVFRVAWRPPAPEELSLRPDPTGYAVYGDGGSGTMDYTTALAVVTHAGSGRPYQWDSAAFAHGTTVQFAVRSRTGTAEEKNTTLVSAVADAEGPAGVAVISAVAGEDS